VAGLKKIFLVEDDAMIRELYKSTLENSKSYIVESASKATDLYKKLEGYQPEYVLLDIMLPETSGLEILNELRKNPKHGCQKAKIIMLTNLAERSVIDKAIEGGADGYIIKSDILPKDLLKILPTV
jgi:two-component system alkaline phosphatase synthesis response regulator PhoP